eukprot:TRINITY_DN1187_c0_g1_i1.p1 TRINITY_DN1187_c0_g1~~TRINITY_DN1187_c0_g1_i1.p1  ORF type:complete len:294 (+),score=109.80 TRINITY_DN1187_c0_g1_i1:90-884(+)
MKELHHVAANDGTFWMCLEDYVHYFHKVFMCMLLSDKVGDVMHEYVFSGEWTMQTGGGCMNNPSWINNPQYVFHIKPAAGGAAAAAAAQPVDKKKKKEDAAPKTCRVIIAMSQEDKRMKGKEDDIIGFLLLQTNKPTERVTKLLKGMPVGDPVPYSKDRDITYQIELEYHKYYVIIPTTFEAGKLGKFYIRMFCKEELVAGEVGGSQAVEIDPEAQAVAIEDVPDIPVVIKKKKEEKKEPKPAPGEVTPEKPKQSKCCEACAVM